MVQPSPFPLTIGDSKFKLTFFQPSSETVQVHIDYDVVIKQSNKEISPCICIDRTAFCFIQLKELLPFLSNLIVLEIIPGSCSYGYQFHSIRTEYASFNA